MNKKGLTLVNWPFWRRSAEWPNNLSVLAVPSIQLIQILKAKKNKISKSQQLIGTTKLQIQLNALLKVYPFF